MALGTAEQNLLREPSSRLAPAPSRHPHLLGPRLVGGGVEFAVFSPRATQVELCLVSLNENKNRVEECYSLYGPHNGIWHGYFPQVRPGQVYGYRAYGPWDPQNADRFNPYKILLDPYGQAIYGAASHCPQVYAHKVDSQLQVLGNILTLDPTDSLPYAPLSVVGAATFPVAPKPLVPWDKTVIYETHVRGLTKNMKELPEHLRGTYAGLANPVTIDYLKRLGITTIELLPIHAFVSESFLKERGLKNYWGYSTLSYFAPEPSYATKTAQENGPQAVLDEVRGMVSLLHQAGIEVIMDVVYNHTCEGGVDGPSFSWRGLANCDYYLHDPSSPGKLLDMTGCSNTLDFSNTRVIAMTLDSLRYWASVVGVDGFRFDLAVTLGRNHSEFSPRHPFFEALASDPILAGCKMISEPWDLGPSGWRTGQFPIPFADWNDRYRDAIRRFWMVDAAAQGRGRATHGPHELATRLSGSADMFSFGQIPGGRGPHASINYVTAHDGFTLADLVSFEHKNNLANKEDNRDGTNNNLNWNHGAEGSLLHSSGTDFSDMNAIEQLSVVTPLRMRNLRNMIGTLLVSAGTPMLLGGDEFGRTQGGNNNAYCQDNDISYYNWDLLPWQRYLQRTVQFLLQLRATHPVMRPNNFASGEVFSGDALADLSWYDRWGKPLTPSGWHDSKNRVLQMLRSGAPWNDVDMLVVFNGNMDMVTVNPPKARSRVFRLIWDSTWCDPENKDEVNINEILGIDLPLDPNKLQASLSREEKKKQIPEASADFAAEFGETPSYGIRLAEAISELPVTVHGMSSQMEALSMRIFFAEVPNEPAGDPKTDLMNLLQGLRES